MSRGFFILLLILTTLTELFAQEINKKLNQPESYSQRIKNIEFKLKEGEILYNQNPDSAIGLWMQGKILAENLLKNNGFRNDSIKLVQNILGELCFNIGSYYYYKSRIQLASSYYLQARSIFNKTGNQGGEGLCLNNIGLIHQYFLAEYDKALENYRKANILLNLSGDLENQSTALHNIANVYSKKNQQDLALKYYDQSLEIRRKIKETNSGLLGQTLYNLATIYYNQKLINRAKENLFECMEIYQNKHAEKRMLAHTCASLAYIYFDTDQPDSALFYANKSFNLSQEIKFPANIRESSKILKKIYAQKQNWQQAVSYMKEYIDAKDSLNNEELKNEFVRQQIQFDYESKQYDDSISYLIGQQRRDNLIEQQKLTIEDEKNSRNTAILLSLFIVSAGWGIYRRSTLRARDRQNQLKIESLENKQRLLRAQMNPHYIFNSLSIIQGLLISNEVSLSKLYLQKFSALIRSVLDLSAKQYVSLREEIESVRLYLELEKLRLKEKLSFAIEIEENLAVNSIRIPPMLIQPFVENAILHGIRHLETGGDIRIHFSLRDQFLICVIQDNGIGRRASAAINRQNKSRKDSLATELSLKRLRSKSHKNQTQGDIIITDLYDHTGNSTGTRVELLIPIQSEYHDQSSNY